jgi:hypothetical protein
LLLLFRRDPIAFSGPLCNISDRLFRLQIALLRRVFAPRGLNALHDGKAQEYDSAHRDPMRRNMEYHRAIDQPGNHYQEPGKVNPE